MIHQTFVQWALYILFKFVKSLIKIFGPSHRKCPTCPMIFVNTASIKMASIHTEMQFTWIRVINHHLNHWKRQWPYNTSLRIYWPKFFITLKPSQNGCHFADIIFKFIFLNENVWISINISLKFVPKGQINNNLAFVQIMACHPPGDNPLSEPMLFSS